MNVLNIANLARAVRNHVLLKWFSRTIAVVGSVTTAYIILSVLYRFVLPPVIAVTCFLWLHWCWTLAGVVTLSLVVAAITAADGGCCCCSEPEWESSGRDFRVRALRPCTGSAYGSAYSASDCVRIDPRDNCFRIEPCVGISIGNRFVDPFPKLSPCPDVLARDGMFAPELQYRLCVSIDPVVDCYRPVDC